LDARFYSKSRSRYDNTLTDKDGTQFVTTTNEFEATVARLPADMVFFPRAIQKIIDKGNSDGVVKEDAYTELDIELSSMNEQQFDRAFEAAFEKMMDIGTPVRSNPRIANRPKPNRCTR
jgi:choline kinase